MLTASLTRRYDCPSRRNHISLSASEPLITDRQCLEPHMQRSCVAPMRRISRRDPVPVPQRYAGPESTESFNLLAKLTPLNSTYPSLPLPLPQHNLQIPPLRIPAPDLARRDRRSR